MLRNYVKTAWRNLIRNKGFALTNLVSLTIGITSTLLILLWVQSELSWNKHQRNYTTTYQVSANRNFNGNIVTDNSVMLPLADALKQKLPEIKHAAYTSYPEDQVLATGEKKIKKTGYRVSKAFFDIFSYERISGNLQASIAIPDAIILTKSTAFLQIYTAR